MDKEMPVSGIWLATGVALPVAVLVGLLWRWLLLPAFVASMMAGPALAWVEWHDPFVGPSIARETGASYGHHAQGAVLILLLLHTSLWLALSARARAGHSGSWLPLADSREAGQTVLFTAALSVSLFLFAAGGFGRPQWLWSSPPMLVSGALLACAALWWFRASWVAQ
jgi:hypothetical protein